MESQTIGKIGENLAANYLSAKGYKILQKNFRAKQYGEVDLVVAHPDGQTMVFVEVKTRTSDQFGQPEEAVGFRKMRELRKMVFYYSNLYSIKDATPQIDVIAIKLGRNDDMETLEHFENVTL